MAKKKAVFPSNQQVNTTELTCLTCRYSAISRSDKGDIVVGCWKRTSYKDLQSIPAEMRNGFMCDKYIRRSPEKEKCSPIDGWYYDTSCKLVTVVKPWGRYSEMRDTDDVEEIEIDVADVKNRQCGDTTEGNYFWGIRPAPNDKTDTKRYPHIMLATDTIISKEAILHQLKNSWDKVGVKGHKYDDFDFWVNYVYIEEGLYGWNQKTIWISLTDKRGADND